MLRSIHFNNQFGRSTVKIHNVFAYNPLFIYFNRIFPKKKIPKLTFMGSHIPAKLPGFF